MTEPGGGGENVRFYRYLNGNKDSVLTGHRHVTLCLESDEPGIDETE